MNWKSQSELVMVKKQERKLGPLDPENKYSIYSAAISIMALFADSLLEVIDEKLGKLYGKNWQELLVAQNLLEADQNLRDVHALLKEIARNGTSQLRMPINSRIAKRNELKSFYDELDNLLAERNAWVHRHVQESKDELIGLAELIRLVSAIAEINVIQECDRLIDTLRAKSANENEMEKPVLSLPTIEASSPLPEKKWVFGDPINTQFTSHSYVISETYDVEDRITNTKLSSIRPATSEMLTELLKKLRSGARLRITQDGLLSAFFAENWGYVAQVQPEEWFPNHLNQF
jgi:hypothetical protein